MNRALKTANAPISNWRPLRLLITMSGEWDSAAVQYAVDLAAALSDRGHEVCFAANPDSPALQRANSAKIGRVEAIDFKSTRPLLVLRNLKKFYNLVVDFSPHLINAHQSADHLFSSLLFFRQSLPIVRTRGGPRPPKKHLINYLLYRTAAAHVACADFIAGRHYGRLVANDAKKFVIRPGVDLESIVKGAPNKQQARRRLGLEQDAIWIGLIARYTKAKAHMSLLEAFSLLCRDADRNLRLLCSGLEYDVSIVDLEHAARKLGISERVLFLSGKKSDVRPLLRALDLLVVPSISSEGIARIALEGLALGVPMVVSSVNSLPEIAGDVGKIVAPGDIDGMARAIFAALSDQRFSENAQVQGPARVHKRYNYLRQIELTEELFVNIVDSCGS